MNKQQLASKIWESANRMRSKIEANEYKDYILGFIFYKFLSDKEVRYLKDNDWTDEYLPQVTEEDEETREDIERQIEDEERALTGMLGELCGNEFDMKGITELRLLLGGSENA